MELATKSQLRWAFLRRAVVTVPLILLLGIGSSVLAGSGEENRWYAMLTKPAGTPPGWVFPVAWTTLYVLMGVALAMVLNARGSRLRGIAILLFVVQFLGNLAWSPLFFGMHQVRPALFLLIGFAVAAIAATIAFGRIRTLAAWLLVPYLVWLCYAACLNWGIDRLNPNAATIVPSAPGTQIEL